MRLTLKLRYIRSAVGTEFWQDQDTLCSQEAFLTNSLWGQNIGELNYEIKLCWWKVLVIASYCAIKYSYAHKHPFTKMWFGHTWLPELSKCGKSEEVAIIVDKDEVFHEEGDKVPIKLALALSIAALQQKWMPCISERFNYTHNQLTEHTMSRRVQQKGRYHA